MALIVRGGWQVSTREPLHPRCEDIPMKTAAPDLFPYAPRGPAPLDFWHWAIHHADTAIHACPEAGRLGRAFLEYVGVDAPITTVTTVPGKWLRPGLVFVDVWANIDDRVELLLHRPGHVRPGPALDQYFASRPSSVRIVRVELDSAFAPHLDADAHFPSLLPESKLLPLLEAADGSHPAILEYGQRLRGVVDSRHRAFEDALSKVPDARRVALMTTEGQWAYLARVTESLHESARDRLLPWGAQRAFPAVDYWVSYPDTQQHELRYRIEARRSGPELGLLHRASASPSVDVSRQSLERIRELWKTACERARPSSLQFMYEPWVDEMSGEEPRIWCLAVADYHCDTVEAELGAIHAIFMDLMRED